MTPSNPSNGNPFVYDVQDAQGVKHQIVPVNHTHTKAEITNFPTIDQTPTDGNTTHLISSDAVYEALKDMAKWVTVKQVTLGQGGTDTYSQYGILVGDYIGDFFVYQQIRLVPVGGSDTICEYGAVKTKETGPYRIISDIDVVAIANTHTTSKFNLQVLQ